MLRALYILLTGVIGAAIVHILIVFATPHVSEHDSYSRVMALGAPGTFHRLAKNAEDGSIGPAASTDPFVETAVCAFDLADGAVAVTAGGDPAFWSFAVFDGGANEVFSINDRSVDPGGLTAILATPVQAARLRRGPDDLAERNVVIETKAGTGYMVLRTVAPYPSLRAQAVRFLETARCGPFRPS